METSDSSIIESMRFLTGLPAGLHWLCPRGPDVKDAKDQSSADNRIKATINCMELFSDPDDNRTLDWFKEKVSKFLECQFCVKGWHSGKKAIRKNYEGEYAPDVLDHFIDNIDVWDCQRIQTVLNETETALAAREHGVPAIKYITGRVYVAIYDCMFVPHLIERDSTLARSFVVTFNAIQEGGRHMGMAEVVPALAAFLFMKPPELSNWAMKCLEKMNKPIEIDDYDRWIQIYLERAVNTAAFSTDEAQLETFWKGSTHLLQKLNRNVIVERIAGSTYDLFRLVIGHLQGQSPHLVLILRQLKVLLDKTTSDFWEAVSSMPPVTLLDCIFNNPKFDASLLGLSTSQDSKNQALLDLTDWIVSFVNSLKLSTRPPACESLLFQLFERLQHDRFPLEAQNICMSLGLQALEKTLELFKQQDFEVDEATHQGNRFIVREAIRIAEAQLQTLLRAVNCRNQDDRNVTLTIFRTILETECKIIRSDFKTLLRDSPLTPSAIDYSAKIWEGLYDAFPNDNYEYAQMIFNGVLDLTILERLVAKADPMNEQARYEFNKTLGHLKAAAANFFNRISDFDPLILKRLFGDQHASTTMVFTLFDPFQENYHASTDIMKQAFGTLGKVEALTGLLTEYFHQTMTALDFSVRQLKEMRTFGPMPRFLKSCDNILEIFCSPQSGLLTLKKLPINPTNKLLLRQFWNNQWSTLGVVFDTCVKWSQVMDKEIMVEFTRDVMEYAGKLFSELSTFEECLADSGESITIDLEIQRDGNISEFGKQLLAEVSSILARVASWLRLRDEALLRMCQLLLCRMLKKFHQADVEPDTKALDTCHNMALGAKKKYITNMTAQQRAELLRAIALYRPVEMVEEVKQEDVIPKTEPLPDTHLAKRLKVGTIDLDSWTTKSQAFSSMAGTGREAKPSVSNNLGSTKIPLIEVPSRKPEMPNRRPQKPSTGGASSLLKDLKAGVKSDVRARNAMQMSNPPKPSINATEGSRLKSLDALIVPQVEKQVKTVEEYDSSSSDDQEDIGNAVFAITKSIKPSNDKPKGPRRTGFIDGPSIFTRNVPLGDPGPRQVQSAADIRARLTPDLTPLYRSIMGWNFFHQGDLPPNSMKSDYTMVTQSFSTAKEYADTFEPLLILECWQQIVKAREEVQNSSFDVKVVTRLAADGFVEIQTNIASPIMTANSFTVSDVILLSTSPNPMTSEPDTSCLSMVHTITRKGAHVEISLRCLPPPTLLTAIRPNASLRGIKIFSLTPIEREYGALKALAYYHLCEQVIRGRPHMYIEPERSKVQGTMRVYRVNEPQAKAIIGAVRNDGFSLIQGPPGTGKTKTVIGIIGAILTDDKGVAISVPGSKSASSSPVMRKLLVCAPSNAAVDELVIRLKEGVVKTNGEKFIPNIVRLGRSDAINQAVRDVTLEELVDKKIMQIENEESKKQPNGPPKNIDELRAQMNTYLSERDGKRLALDHARQEQNEPPASLRKEVDDLSRRIKDLGRQMDELRDQRTTVNRNKDIRRRQFQQEVLDGAHVLCATLSGTGHDTLRSLKVEFETVIIDEAAQCIELSALIPLKFGCKKCIMVGDPKQLPPTVLSREASRFAYEQSLFVRMQKNHPETVHLLSIQYRMHPEISLFPSHMFYSSQLQDGPKMEELRTQIWHGSLFFGPYRFFNVLGQENTSGHSMRNPREVTVALKIYKRLVLDFPEIDFDGKIGIITPYKTQLRDLREKFKAVHGEQILKSIEFNTTDAFQGREREIIIFSCVRASQKASVGFLSDIRRMNVGLTRAKSSLFVLGNAETLSKNEFWGKLVNDAKKRDRFTTGNFEQLLERPSRTNMKQLEKRLKGVAISPPATVTNFQEDHITSDSTMLTSPIQASSRASHTESEGSLRRPSLVPASKAEAEMNDVEKTKRHHPHKQEKLSDRKQNLSSTHSEDVVKKRRHEELNLSNPSFDTSSDMPNGQASTTQTGPSRDNPMVPPAAPRPSRPPVGSRGPLPPKKKKNVEDAMFIRRKPPRP